MAKTVQISGKELDVDVPGTDSRKSIDDTDRRLINILVQNGRMSNIEIAEKLGTSEATVRRRIDNLLQNGVIRGFAALLDYKKLGNTLKANIHLKVNISALGEVASFLSKSAHSCGVYRVIGKYNLYTEIIFENIQAFQAYIDNLSSMDKIENFDFHIVTHSFKACPWTGI